jgi:TrpR-related protein YerC/YecD
MPKQDNKKTENLLKAILSLQDIKESKKFFRDLMTESEIVEFGNRWQAAQMLYNKISYSEIEKETGLSSRTIARVAKWLNKGKNGYKSMLQRMDSHHTNSFFRKELC